MNHALRIAWFRYRANSRRRSSSLLTIVVLIGLIGGVALASIAGARRTDSSFPTYLASTNPSTAEVISTYDAPGLGVKTGFDPVLDAKIGRLPTVTRSTNAVIFDGNINLNGVKGLHAHVIAGETPPRLLAAMTESSHRWTASRSSREGSPTPHESAKRS